MKLELILMAKDVGFTDAQMKTGHFFILMLKEVKKQ